ncbi:S-adenosyl-L-methionine-dependent methyltransferases superfamily protein [Actinidia rufa]|uniref:S-adenosyl-L-methionine-dependent methyltransferases superfamily protein n=1 Tax=Actinidia rufa TaxID=165716 RepID=A0A7J0GK61_9ERIC|nr:S-adenosyl-L-methionine-dependent methyltransferases superfamily protein [Actinidia rufa]
MATLDAAATFESLVPSRFTTLNFPNPSHSTTTTRHHLYSPLLRVAVLDSPSRSTINNNSPKIAAMLVPIHRETDWTFSTEAGHLQLLLNLPEISRLILIGNLPIDPRPTIYNKPPPIDQINQSIIKESLRPLLFALCPKSVFNSGLPEIQFLGYEDDVIRSVTVVRERVSEEEVEVFRRMPNLVQTQMRIVPKRGSHVNGDLGSMSLGDFEFELDTVSLVQPYFAPMVAILSLVGSCLEETIRGGFRPKALCLGVGGGALLTFLNEQLGFEVVGVEADEVALSVARKYFGLQDGKYVRVCVGDGIEFIGKLAGQVRKLNSDYLGDFSVDNGCWLGNADRLDDKFDVIMVDLDSSDVGMGTMAPPLEFVEKSVLRDARLVLSEHGILVINMIPPNRSFYELLVHEFREFFSELYEIDVGNGENFVLVATATAIRSASSDTENSFLTKLKLLCATRYAVGGHITKF